MIRWLIPESASAACAVKTNAPIGSVSAITVVYVAMEN